MHALVLADQNGSVERVKEWEAEMIWERQRTFGSGEVDDIAIFFEHVDLLDGLDGLDVQLLQRGLQLLVVCAGGLVHLLGLAPGCAFAAVGRGSC